MAPGAGARVVGALALLAAGASPAASQGMDAPARPTPGGQTDWERRQEAREFRESTVALPPYFREEDLVEFTVAPTTRFRFYVDRASLSVGEDGVVRYTLVARSPQGAENVTYEGIRCRAGTHRVYALGQPDRTWKPVTLDWQPSDRLWVRVLRREYFCPMQLPVHSVAEALDALRRGGHPERQRTEGR